MQNSMESQTTAIERAIGITTHGRYLVVQSTRPSAPLLVGFHGYAESAETQVARLQSIPGCDAWTAVSIQGLHRFYERRTDQVVASWMTRQDREVAIADNVAYVAAIVEAEWTSTRATGGVVYAGFSQGVAMAFRAAVNSARPVLGVVAAGGDVPPEIEPGALNGIGPILLCRGTEDRWYTNEKFTQDQTRLQEAGIRVTALEFAGGHQWSAAVVDAARSFLQGRLR
jgi:predicted esterase